MRWFDFGRGHSRKAVSEAALRWARISLADTLHNIRAIMLDYERLGDELWERFNPDSDQLWYYGALAKLFARRRPNLHAKELSRYVADLQRAMA